MNPTEVWISDNLHPRKSSSARLVSDRMELQSGGQLVGIYQAPTPDNRYHWRDTALCEAFTEAVCGVKPGVIMDIGPGDGWPSLTIAPRCKHIIGIDPSDRRVAVQRGNAQRLGISNCEFYNMDVQDLTFPNDSFDGVVAASSIEQAEDPVKGLSEIFRVLKPGARLAMICEMYDDRIDNNSEELIVDTSESCCLLSYVIRQSRPPREARYGISLENEILQDSGVRQALHSISVMGSKWFANNDLIELLSSLRRSILNSCYYELHHFTPESLEEALYETGYTDVKGFSGDINGLMPFADFAIKTDSAKLLGETFIELSRKFGAASVRSAGPGANSFTMAAKSCGGS